MPQLITRQDMANSTAERFRLQYGPNFATYQFGDSRKIRHALIALGPKPRIDDVEALVPGWTFLTCDECKRNVDAVVQVGEPYDYGSNTARLCADCLDSSRSLICSQQPASNIQGA